MAGDAARADAGVSDPGAAFEANLQALFRAMVAIPGSAILESEQVCCHLSPPDSTFFRGAWGTRVAEDEVDDVIDMVIGWFRARGAASFFWWIGPGTRPRDLGRRLAAKGLHPVDSAGGAPILVAKLERLNEAALRQVPAGFTVEEAHDEAALEAFKRVLVAGYPVPEAAAQAWVEASERLGPGETPWRLLLGRLNGEAVATHIAFNGGGLAGVYGVAVLPWARRRGIGGAITLTPLLEARAMGYRRAGLFSSELGRRAYERIGFRDTGARIRRYLWQQPG